MVVHGLSRGDTKCARLGLRDGNNIATGERCRRFMVVDALRRILGRTGVGEEAAPEYGVFYDVSPHDELISRLQRVKVEFDNIKYRLINEIESEERRLVEAIKKGDSEEINEIAATIMVKKNMLKGAMTLTRIISMSIGMIENARNLEAMAAAIAGVNMALKAYGEHLSAVNPEAMSAIAEFIDESQKIIASTMTASANMPSHKLDFTSDPQIREIIAKAAREAMKESDRIVGPIDELIREAKAKTPEDIEKDLLDYIKKNNGVVRIREAASQLGVTPEEVKQALFRLHEKGLVQIKGGSSREAQTA